MAMNKGEWSELYSILALLVDPKMNIVNDKFECITNELYMIKDLTIEEKENILKYIIEDNNTVAIHFDNILNGHINKSELNESKIEILNAINNNINNKGAFEIASSDNILNKMTINNIIKAKSTLKSDVKATVFDSRFDDERNLSYSIKSSLGSPATILNASSHTNFIFEVTNLNIEDIELINEINTSKKLKDRIQKIYDLGGEISFSSISSNNFNYNLQLIDSSMPTYLAKTLLNSYSKDSKNLKKLFIEANDFPDNEFAIRKLGDLLCGISFGFFPSKQWNGINEVNGGLIIVKRDGNVVVMDLVYFAENVRKYLIENTKLDSPSSSRYNMLNLYVEDGRIYFTLNLQIRYES